MNTTDSSTNKSNEPQGGRLTDIATTAVPQLRFLKYWRVALFAVLLVIIGVQSYRVATRDTEIAEFALVKKGLVDENARMVGEVANANAALADSNSKITEFTKKNGEILSDFEEFRDNFDVRVQQEAYKRAEKIRKENTPKSCLEAEQFLRDHLGGR